MDICGAVHVAALHTMILLDPDLDDHPAPDRPKGATLHDSPQLERHRRTLSARALGLFLNEAQAAVRLRGLVSVLLTTDTEIRRLNRVFRGKNKATDVLSFPAGEASRGTVAGDLAISITTARRQAAEQGHALAVEVKVLMLHGLLHLAGYDHEADDGRMARRERLLRGRLKLPQGLIERGSLPTLATEKNRKDGARSVRATDGRKTGATQRAEGVRA
jgi:probable rRNA maturation factor